MHTAATPRRVFIYMSMTALCSIKAGTTYDDPSDIVPHPLDVHVAGVGPPVVVSVGRDRLCMVSPAACDPPSKIVEGAGRSVQDEST